MTAVKPPLDLAVEVADSDGVRYRWDSGDRYAGNRPQGLSFSTKRGEGFDAASVTLARRIDRDYVDLSLFDDVVFAGADGSTAYEGRVAEMPRSVQDAHSIDVTFVGHMAHARDRQFTEVYVDRDLSTWTTPSRARQGSLLSSNYGLHSFDAARDSTNSQPALVMKIDGAWISPFLPMAEALYDAGPGNQIASVYVSTQGGTGVAGNASFAFNIIGGPSDASFDVNSGDLWAGTDTAGYQAIGPRRFIALSFQYATTPSGSDGASFTLGARNLTMYGDHGLTVYGTDPKGVVASDVIKDIVTRFCPKLNTAGVLDTAWPIPHLVFKDQTDPYDAFLAINAFHLWELGVWEDKTLHFGPSDRTDYDWEVRLSDYGVGVQQQGDSTESLANGIVVDYTNVATGAKDVLTPDVYTDLADSNPDNVVNTHGLQRWTKLSLSSPTTTDSAIQIGRTALAEFNQPKAPGTITATGHVRDRAGHWQQGWKVRAGDTIAITDHPNDSPRLITETNWNHDSKQLTVTTDSANMRLDAVLDRVGVALTAAGLS